MAKTTGSLSHIAAFLCRFAYLCLILHLVFPSPFPPPPPSSWFSKWFEDRHLFSKGSKEKCSARKKRRKGLWVTIMSIYERRESLKFASAMRWFNARELFSRSSHGCLANLELILIRNLWVKLLFLVRFLLEVYVLKHFILRTRNSIHSFTPQKLSRFRDGVKIAPEFLRRCALENHMCWGDQHMPEIGYTRLSRKPEKRKVR